MKLSFTLNLLLAGGALLSYAPSADAAERKLRGRRRNTKGAVSNGSNINGGASSDHFPIADGQEAAQQRRKLIASLDRSCEYDVEWCDFRDGFQAGRQVCEALFSNENDCRGIEQLCTDKFLDDEDWFAPKSGDCPIDRRYKQGGSRGVAWAIREMEEECLSVQRQQFLVANVRPELPAPTSKPTMAPTWWTETEMPT